MSLRRPKNFLKSIRAEGFWPQEINSRNSDDCCIYYGVHTRHDFPHSNYLLLQQVCSYVCACNRSLYCESRDPRDIKNERLRMMGGDLRCSKITHLLLLLNPRRIHSGIPVSPRNQTIGKKPSLGLKSSGSFRDGRQKIKISANSAALEKGNRCAENILTKLALV